EKGERGRGGGRSGRVWGREMDESKRERWRRGNNRLLLLKNEQIENNIKAGQEKAVMIAELKQPELPSHMCTHS
ncbi:hypothetical protein ACQP3L_37595, partial [Escherichia coli]